MELGLCPGEFVLDGDPATLRIKEAEPPKLRSMDVYCGQTARWIKIVLGMEVGLSPGDFVLDGDPAPLNVRPMFIIVIVISLKHCTGVRRYWFVQVQVQV